MVEFQAYLRAVFTYMAENKGSVRSGQAYYNALHDLRPDLAERFTGKEFDPFYSDSNIPGFLTAVCVLMAQPDPTQN